MYLRIYIYTLLWVNMSKSVKNRQNPPTNPTSPFEAHDDDDDVLLHGLLENVNLQMIFPAINLHFVWGFPG